MDSESRVSFMRGAAAQTAHLFVTPVNDPPQPTQTKRAFKLTWDAASTTYPSIDFGAGAEAVEKPEHGMPRAKEVYKYNITNLGDDEANACAADHEEAITSSEEEDVGKRRSQEEAFRYSLDSTLRS